MGKEPLTEERLVEIRGREKAATQGPWRDDCVVGRRKNFESSYVVRDKDGFAIVDVLPISAYHDAAFIAHAREDIPALLDEVERLRAENEQLKEIAWNGIQLMDKTVIREAAREVDMAREKVLRHAMEQEKR